jgi:hypothetical protein
MRRKDFWIGSGLLEDNNPMPYVVVLFVAIDVVGVVVTCPLGVPLPLLLYPRGRGYKEGNRVGYNIISIRTLSLLTYFVNIFIDIRIYDLRSHEPLESSGWWVES